MSAQTPDQRPVAVLGASGYVGSRLVSRLLDDGRAVRALARNPDKLQRLPVAGRPGLETAPADALDRDSMARALAGTRAVHHLVHSMGGDGGDYAERDRTAARNTAAAAAENGLDRVVYLGGLGGEDELSEHLASRMEVGRILMEGETPCTWLRAAQILGSGSASFEIVRHLVERLPVMVTPRWVETECQPIAISNVLDYLAGCLDAPEAANRAFDIGGPDILSYRQLFQLYAEEAGLRPRIIIPVPVLTPTLSSYWIDLVTPIPAGLARPLVQGLKNRVVCAENDIREVVPAPMVSVRQAFRRSLEGLGRRSRADQCGLPGTEPAEWPSCGDPGYAWADVKTCAFEVLLDGPPEEVWAGLNQLGGRADLYARPALWRLRGWVDERLGGPGFRLGRDDPQAFVPGDRVDFWRVDSVEQGRRLRLEARMRMPGQAVLEYAVEPAEGGTLLRQSLRYAPRGIVGTPYWALLAPAHDRIYAAMLERVARATGRRLLEGPRKAAK